MQHEEQNAERAINQLAEINEALLRSKGRLQQEIIELRKQLYDQAKNVKTIETLSQRMVESGQKIADQRSVIDGLQWQQEELRKKTEELENENAGLRTDIERLVKIKWYQKLFGK